MNWLRATNMTEISVEDVNEAEASNNQPGYFTFTKSSYKTATIYGEKVTVLPKKLFGHLKIYVKKLRPILNGSSNENLFVLNNREKMMQGVIGSAMTASFERTDVFSKSEYPRLSPTRKRCACATFGCMEEVIDSGFFPKTFTKNKEETRNKKHTLQYLC